MLVVRCLFQLWTLPLIRHYPTESDTSHSARVATPSIPARKATSLMKCPMTNAQGPKKVQYPNAKPLGRPWVLPRKLSGLGLLHSALDIWRSHSSFVLWSLISHSGLGISHFPALNSMFSVRCSMFDVLLFRVGPWSLDIGPSHWLFSGAWMLVLGASASSLPIRINTLFVMPQVPPFSAPDRRPPARQIRPHIEPPTSIITNKHSPFLNFSFRTPHSALCTGLP